MTPRDFFLYIGAMITLYWSAGALIALLFRIIDTVFRDDLEYYVDPYSSGIRFAIASLIVVFPISLYLFRTIKKDAVLDPLRLLLPLRRWLYALTIFVTAVALIADGIALLNSFLGGELTIRFALKIISVLVVAGLVFWYCLLEIRTTPGSRIAMRKEFLVGAPILVIAAVVYGFAVMGSPAAQRALRFDDRRVQDLSSIQWQIVNYWQQKSSLPETLADLEDPISGYKIPSDPKTKAPYEFSATAEAGNAPTFELCATFERESVSASMARPYYPMESLSDTWNHGAGRTCFERTIDPELYPTKEVLQKRMRAI